MRELLAAVLSLLWGRLHNKSAVHEERKPSYLGVVRVIPMHHFTCDVLFLITILSIAYKASFCHGVQEHVRPDACTFGKAKLSHWW